jgi:ribosomal protein S18 acetylase RimI-like enzyme
VLVLQRAIGPAAGPPAPDVDPTTLPGVRWSADLDEDWSTAYATTVPASELAARTRLAATAPSPRVYVTIGTIACGMAVLDGELVGLFDLATDPVARRTGHATRVSAALLTWGVHSGARRAYLQVAEANVAARALYERLGFRLAYRYVYAVREPFAQ